VIAALAFTLAAAICPPATEANLRATFDAWVGAYEKRDLQGAMAIFDRDVIFQFQGAPDQTYADLEAGYRADFAHADASRRWRPRFESVMVSGDLADMFSTWRLEITQDGETRVAQTNRGVDVFKRGLDCRWRIVRSLNYPLEAEQRR
jgi:ketosteroid isomerase-like protein